MTDLEKFVALYKDFGIDCRVNQEEGEQKIYLGGFYGADGFTSSDKFDGYSGFYSVARFDLEGKFLGQDFYE